MERVIQIFFGQELIGPSHTHTDARVDIDTETDVLPPYLDMVIASINSDGVGETDSVLIVSALPPLGWERFGPG